MSFKRKVNTRAGQERRAFIDPRKARRVSLLLGSLNSLKIRPREKLGHKGWFVRINKRIYVRTRYTL